MKRVLLATRSQGKLAELRPLFAAAGYHAVDLMEAGIPEVSDEDAIESHPTFEANALAKARHFHALSGIPSFADDSGLVVDSLGGRPGVQSKRWSRRDDLRGRALDEANNETLIGALTGAVERSARYVCVAACASDEVELIARGETEGSVLDAPRGDGGFGYDPLFASRELGRTFAEVTRAEKERVSHRGRAFRALFAALALSR